MNSNFTSGHIPNLPVQGIGATTTIYTQDDYSQAVDIQGFRFTEKKGRLDWKQVEQVDMDRVIREVDIDKVERLL